MSREEPKLDSDGPPEFVAAIDTGTFICYVMRSNLTNFIGTTWVSIAFHSIFIT